MPFLLRISINPCLVIIALLVMAWGLVVPARGAPPTLTPPPDGLSEILHYGEIVRRDNTPLPLTRAIEIARLGNAIPVEIAVDKSGLVYGPVWIHLIINNPNQTPVRYRFDRRLATANVQTAYVIEADEPQLIWHDDWLHEGFTTRFPKTRRVASAPITIAPKSAVDIWIFYPFGFYQDEDTSLLEENVFQARRLQDTSFTVFIFGLRIALVVGIFAFAFILRFKTALYYGLFSLALLGFFAQAYGYSYAYLFHAYHYDALFRLISGSVGLVFFTQMTRSFLSARTLYPLIDKTLFASIGLAIVLAIIALVDGPQMLGQMLISIGALLIGLANLFAILWGLYKGHAGAWLFFIATVFLLANMMIGTLALPPFKLLSDYQALNLNHLGFAIDTILFASALIIRALAMGTELTHARDAKIAALSQQSKLAKALDHVSAKHQRALALAETRRKELAATSHDLKQPLLSLKMSLQDNKDHATLSKGISYLQTILDRTLEDTKIATLDLAHEDIDQQQEAQSVALDIILKNTATMFGDEAKTKNIQLQVAPTSRYAACEPVILMRLLINLVANAVKHTGQGRVLIGVRPQGEYLAIQIYDTGPGIKPQLMADIFKAYKRGNRSSGEGLGLSIVKEIAEKNGLTLRIRSTPNRGTLFEIGHIKPAPPPCL